MEGDREISGTHREETTSYKPERPQKRPSQLRPRTAGCYQVGSQGHESQGACDITPNARSKVQASGVLKSKAGEVGSPSSRRGRDSAFHHL